jgi:hypothetical protein
MEQLLFFEETKEQQLERRIEELETSLHKVRRALFARHGELAKMYLETNQEFEAWKALLCRKNEYATS